MVPTLIEIRKSQPVISSLKVAEVLERPHFLVMRSIRELIKNGTIRKCDFVLSKHTAPNQVRGYSHYYLTERAALIAMPFIGGRKAAQGQALLVDAFLAAREQLAQKAQWQGTRDKGKLVRRTFTDHIKTLMGYGERQFNYKMSRELYGRATVRIYRYMFYHDGENWRGLRDQMSDRQLVFTAFMEELAAKQIEEGIKRLQHPEDILDAMWTKLSTISDLIGRSKVEGQLTHTTQAQQQLPMLDT